MGCDFVMFRLFFGRGDRSKTWQIFKQSWCRNTTLLGTNMYHLWKRNIIFQNCFKTGFLDKQNVSFVPLNHFGDFGWEGYFPVTEDLPLALAVLHFFWTVTNLFFATRYILVLVPMVQQMTNNVALEHAIDWRWEEHWVLPQPLRIPSWYTECPVVVVSGCILTVITGMLYHVLGCYTQL